MIAYFTLSMDYHNNRQKSQVLVKLQEVQQAWTWDCGRPPRNIDILQFIMTRTDISLPLPKRMSLAAVNTLAGEMIKKCWLSLGLGIESRFVTGSTMRLRIRKVHEDYKHFIKGYKRNSGSMDILTALLQKRSPKYTDFGDIFFPLTTQGASMTDALKINRWKLTMNMPLDSELITKIRPSVLSVPSFEEQFRESPSSWLSPPIDEDLEQERNSGHPNSIFLDDEMESEAFPDCLPNFDRQTQDERTYELVSNCHCKKSMTVCDRSSQTDLS